MNRDQSDVVFRF